MTTPPTPDDVLRQTVEAYNQAGRNQTHAARILGIARETLQTRLRRAADKGMFLDHPPAMPGFRIAQVTDGPNGKSVQQRPEHGEQFVAPESHVIKGVSALVDSDGREVVKWIKTKEGELDPMWVVEQLKGAFQDYQPAATPCEGPSVADNDLLTLIPISDWHLGMFGWHREVGENWDLKIAETAIGSAMDELMVGTRPSGTAVILGLGDLFHSDNNENRTARSGNVLQVDGRYQKIILTGGRMIVRVVDRALLRHHKVVVRILQGNHDEHAAVAAAYFLLAWYRNEPRVEVDADPSLFWWYRFGEVMLGATHGHTVKLKNMPQIMAHRRAEDWGQTKWRYVHGGHLHHAEQTMTEGGGCITEIHQAPIPQDAWHFGAGFISGRSLQAITYHRHHGERSRTRIAMADAEPLRQAA